MTNTEETLVYDAMRLIQKHAEAIVGLANASDDPAIKEAYKSGVYVPCIKLQVALGPEAMERGKARYEELDRKAKEFFATHRNDAINL